MTQRRDTWIRRVGRRAALLAIVMTAAASWQHRFGQAAPLALRTLRRTLVDGPVVTGVEDLGRWLEDFHPRSWLELDYAGLVHLQDAQELTQDHSARDVAQALHALEEDRTDEASAAYVRLVERWRKVAALEHAN